MKITQRNSRTLEIAAQGGTLQLSYHIVWNGHEREPESIVLDGDEARAFFLFATVVDRISEDRHGLIIARTWSIKTPGSFRLSIEAVFPIPGERSSCLFPGSALVCEPGEPRALPAGMMSLPGALTVFAGEHGILFFSELPGNGGDEASIGVRRNAGEDGETLVVEVRIPPAGLAEPGPAPGAAKAGRTRVPEAAQSEIASTGSLEMKRTLYVVFSKRGAIILRGIQSAFARLDIEGREPEAGPGMEEWKAALAACLRTHLFESGGVMGLRETPSSRHLSASAGASLALLLVRMFASDAGLGETALRLADFCLKGQHPTGLFFETYSIEDGEWVGAKGSQPQAGRKSAEAPRIPIAESAAIADGLLRLSQALASRGMPSQKYRLAAVRFVEFFLDEKGKIALPGALHVPGERVPAEPGISGLEVFFPLLRLFEETGRDRYRRALQALTLEFLSLPLGPDNPPVWREGREPDSRAALLCGRMAVEMDRIGWEDIDAELYLSILVPWVHMNRTAASQGADPMGGIADSFRRQRLLFCGAEAAYILLSLARKLPRPEQETVRELARLAWSFSRAAPLGSAFLQHAGWISAAARLQRHEGILGPVDSRRLTREACFTMKLLEESARPGGRAGASRKRAASAVGPEAGAAKKPHVIKPAKPHGKSESTSSSRSGSAGRSRRPSGKP